MNKIFVFGACLVFLGCQVDKRSEIEQPPELPTEHYEYETRSGYIGDNLSVVTFPSGLRCIIVGQDGIDCDWDSL